MSEQNESLPTSQRDDENVLVIPAFAKSKELKLGINATKEAETRLVEAKTVNPITYADLEHCFNEAYRELKRHSATIGYQLALADKALEEAKSTIFLDTYPEFMKGRPKSQDNSDLRKAFMMRDPAYIAAIDRINMLKAMESFVDGKIKVLENVCRYMRTQMQLTIRSGLANTNLYNTQTKK